MNEVIEELDGAIEKAQSALKRELAKLRTGRAHAGMLDSVGLRTLERSATSLVSR